LLIKLCDRLIAYLNKQKDTEKVARISLIKLERVYYKHDDIYAKTKEQLKAHPNKLEELYFPEGPTDNMIKDLVQLVTEHLPLRMKVKAILLQCYHHAIHNRYFVAKDLLMKSRIAQIIGKQQIVN
jgi:translation initiation factor 3 subunit C